MRVLITGGSGFIGQALCPRLADAGHQVAVLSRSAEVRVPGAGQVIRDLDTLDPADFDAVINLAGASIGEARWTDARKQLLMDSRVGTTSALVAWMRRSSSPPAVLLSASAVGYYGEQGEATVTEATTPTPGFTHDLCAAWEAEAGKAEASGVRVCTVRTGVVLDRGGGALGKMLPAFRFGLGGRLGSGDHYFPWIHRDDIVSVYLWLLGREAASGPYNASAPNPVTNLEFTEALSRALGRPALLPVPTFALRALFGEMSELLLVSDRMVPGRLLEEGFRFRHTEVGPALQAILG